MAPMTPGRRIGGVAILFVVAIACVGVASVTHSVIPVFLAWVPLLAVPWWLTRPEAGTDGPASEERIGPGVSDASDGADPPVG